MTEAKQALVDSPSYHRVPVHYRNGASIDNTTTPPVRSVLPEMRELDASVYAPERRRVRNKPNNFR